MKKIILLATLCVAFFIPTQAQSAKTASKNTTQPTKQVVKETPEERAKVLLNRMNKACKLNPDQFAKITKAYVDYYTKHDALKAKKDILDKKVVSERGKDLQKKRDQVIQATLNAEQLKLWEAYKEKQKQAEKESKKAAKELD